MPYRFAIVVLAWLVALPAAGMDHVTFRSGKEKKESRVTGRVVVTAQDGGILLEGRDGTLWAIQPDDLVRQDHDDILFKHYGTEQLGDRLLAELPQGFEIHRTEHYLICHNTSREYARWCGSLFERLYAAFTNYWGRKGFQLAEPRYPLVAIVFADQRSYQEHARREVGEMAGSIIGYFGLTTNRMTMYDLTGSSPATGRGRKGGTAAQINRILSQPDAERTVATIIHEATHQIAFNCGLHTRLSDCPRWFSEGIAIYFETPDLKNAKLWNSIGGMNQFRLGQFQTYARRRPADSLVTLLTDDKRFREAKQANDAYAEAWALTYFLIRQRPKEYIAYLQVLSAKKPMVWDDAETRLGDFKQAFGEDLNKLDAEFVRYMLRGK